MDSPKVNTITEMQAKKSYEPKKNKLWLNTFVKILNGHELTTSLTIFN